MGQHAAAGRLVELGADVGVQLGHDRRDRVDAAAHRVDDLALALEPMLDERRDVLRTVVDAVTRGSG